MSNVITDNLDLWSSALLTKSTAGRGNNGRLEAYGIKKLRELILDLAVRGKLVAQDLNDEPACELLERIRAERVRLLNEKKIRKADQLPPVSVEEAPYELPLSWVWTYMSQLSDQVHYGYTASADHSSTEVRMLRITDIQDNRVNWDAVPGCKIDPEVVSSYELKNGDLLIARTGGTIGKSYLVENLNLCAVFASYLIRVIPNRLSLPSYIKLYADSPLYWRQLYEKSMGTGQPNVNGVSLSSLLLPLPPIAEQHRIVAKVDELMALCDHLEQQQTNNIEAHQTLVEALLGTLTNVESHPELNEAWTRIADHFDALFTTEQSIDRLKQTILQLAVMGKLVPQDPDDEPAEFLLARAKAAKEQLSIERRLRQSEEVEFSEPESLFDLPDGWTSAHVTDVALIQGGKRLPPGAELVDTPTPHIYIRVTDMKDGSILESGLKYLLPDVQREISRYKINKEDIYITIAGTIGSVGIIPDWLDGQNLTENAAKIVFRLLDKRFFLLALSSDFVQSQFLEKTKQMAQPKLALKRIAGAKVCLPPLEEQHRIVAKVDELMALCDDLKTRLASAQTTQLHLADTIVEQAVA